MRSPFALAIVAVTTLAALPAANAQQAFASQSPRTVAAPLTLGLHADRLSTTDSTTNPAPTGAFTFNPLGLPLQYFAAEYEMKTGTALSTGVAGSYFAPPGGDGHYATLELKVRYYPNEVPLKGFSLGGAVGMTNVGYTDTQCNPTCTDVKQSATKPTAGVVVDYNWLLGKHDQFMIGIGAGMKRIFGVSANDSNISFAYPTARLMFGWVR